MGPNTRISGIRAAPVASEFAYRATAEFPEASRSPMIPEPTTATRSIPVPKASAASLR